MPLLSRRGAGNIKKDPAELFYKEAVFKDFAIFTGKRLCWSLFLIELQAFRPTALFGRDSNTGVLL